MNEAFESHHVFGGKRLLETHDPQVDALFEGETAGRVGILIEHIPELSLKQKVHALLLLTDEEFTDFTTRRAGGAEFALKSLAAKKGEMTNEDYIRAISQLRDSHPRYEVEAEIRRRWKGNYPSDWDQDLEEDFRFQSGDGLLRMKAGKPLTYEKAIEFTRFENTRSWYRNVYFPQVTRWTNPLPLDMSTLIQLFRQHRELYFDPQKPRTDISMKDLLVVLDYYLDYEFDNGENCRVHKVVQKLAGTINELEDAIGE